MKRKNNTPDWSGRFREWEAAPQPGGDWDSPSLGLWDRIAEDLPKEPPRRPWGYWRWTIGALCGIMIVALSLWPSSMALDSFPIPMRGEAQYEASAQRAGEKTTVADKGPKPLVQKVATDNEIRKASTIATSMGNTSLSSPTAGLEERSSERPNLLTIVDPQSADVVGQEIPKSATIIMTIPANAPKRREVQAVQAHLSTLNLALPERAYTLKLPTLDASEPTVATKPQANWVLQGYTSLPLNANLAQQRRNWQIEEQQLVGMGASLQYEAPKGWLAQLGLQYDQSNYDATTRFVRTLNIANERDAGDQKLSDYELDTRLLKSAGEPTTVTLARERDVAVEDELRIILQVTSKVSERNWRAPLYVGYQLDLGTQWQLDLKAGMVVNKAKWERWTAAVEVLNPRLQVRDIRVPERVVSLETWSVQSALAVGVQYTPQPHWQVGLQWQRLGTNKTAPQILQGVDQQLLLGLAYRW